MIQEGIDSGPHGKEVHMITREVENPTLRDLLGLTKFSVKEKHEIFRADILSNIQVVGSGKGAITLVLGYLTQKNIIVSRNDEMIVSDWIGTWVYNEMLPHIFPAKKFSERTKAMFVYHQYGFPQDMDKILEFAHDKKMIVIEDCAHAVASKYKGKPVGTMGDFAIFSFSKWFFCFALGGVRSQFSDFAPYVEKMVASTPFGVTTIKDAAKFLSEWSTFSHSLVFKKYANLFLTMSYSLYEEALRPCRVAKKLLASKIEYEVSIRRKRYRYFLERVGDLGICDHLEREGITPYVIPIYCSESRNDNIISALAGKGIQTGLRHFDSNRNLLSPKFIRCIGIPCHGGISDEKFDMMIELIIKGHD